MRSKLLPYNNLANILVFTKYNMYYIIYIDKVNKRGKNNMKSEDIIKNFQDKYGKDAALYDEETINIFFTDLFYDIDDEDDLNEINKAEDYIRNLFNVQYN